MNPTPGPLRFATRWCRLLVVLAASLIVVSGCKATRPEPVTSGLPGAVVTQTSWAPDVLEQLLAPIALYPDELIGMILAASVNSQEVLDAGNWLLANPDLKGDALDAGAKKAGFGDPMRGLVHFPTVVDMMCQEFDWTRQLGSAFTSDQKGVLDAIQRLRASAAAVGNLQSNPQQSVTETSDDGVNVIEVKAADPKVIYVPQYDPQVVYVAPPPPPPTTTQSSSSNTAMTALVMFTLGVAVGNAMHNDYYCYPHYGAGCVYVGPHRYYPPAYVYHPAYPPAHGYRPPPGYPHSYNKQVNVTVNKNYYNQFNNNANLKGGGARSPIATPTRTAARAGGPKATPAGGQAAWKGQSAYAGAKPAGQRGQSTAGVNPNTRGAAANTPSAQPRAGGAGSPSVSGGAQANRSPQADRGYGTSDRAGVESRARDGGASPAGGASARPAQASSSPSTQGSGGAFAGASQPGSGSFDQAASARGRASTSSSSGASRSSSPSGGRSGGSRKR
jgi:hypothetical protein